MSYLRARDTCVFIMKKHFPIYFAKIELSFNFETQSGLSTSDFIFL